MNSVVFEYWVVRHLLPGWTNFLANMTPERRQRARLAVLSDHHSAHVRFVGARACGAKLLTGTIGFCHVGRELTGQSQPVDVGSCARSLKAAMRRETIQMTVQQELYAVLRHARKYQTQFSSEDQFRRCGWLTQVRQELPLFGLRSHLREFLDELQRSHGPHPAWDSTHTRVSAGRIPLGNWPLAGLGEENLPEPDLDDEENAVNSDTHE